MMHLLRWLFPTLHIEPRAAFDRREAATVALLTRAIYAAPRDPKYRREVTYPMMCRVVDSDRLPVPHPAAGVLVRRN